MSDLTPAQKAAETRKRKAAEKAAEQKAAAEAAAAEKPDYTIYTAFEAQGKTFTFREVDGFEMQDFLSIAISFNANTEDGRRLARALCASWLSDLLGEEQETELRSLKPSRKEILAAWQSVMDHMLGDLEQAEGDGSTEGN